MCESCESVRDKKTILSSYACMDMQRSDTDLFMLALLSLRCFLLFCFFLFFLLLPLPPVLAVTIFFVSLLCHYCTNHDDHPTNITVNRTTSSQSPLPPNPSLPYTLPFHTYLPPHTPPHTPPYTHHGTRGTTRLQQLTGTISSADRWV